MASPKKSSKKGKFALLCIFMALPVSILFLLRPKSPTDLSSQKENARDELSTDRAGHGPTVSESNKSKSPSVEPKGDEEDEQIDDLVAKSKIEALDCQKKLQSLQEKLNSSKNSNLVDTLKDLRAIPGVPPSSAVVFARIQQNSTEPWKFGTNVHQLGDCNPSLRAKLLRDIINRAAKLDAQAQKTIVSLVIDNLRTVSNQPAPSLVQLASASTLSALQKSGLLGEDFSLSDEVTIIRDEYRSFSNSVSSQEDAFKVTQLEMDYSERARTRILSMLEARFPTR